MSLLGVHLTLLMGRTVPLPAPMRLAEALEVAKVTHSDTGRSGFELTFHTGRSGPQHLFDYPLLNLPQVQPFSRVILVVRFGFARHVISDGVITKTELVPGKGPGKARIVVTGEDISGKMDLEVIKEPHPGLDEATIAKAIIKKYTKYGLTANIVPPRVVVPPNPIERVPAQNGTDREYLEELARRHGYVFHVTPGAKPKENSAYWGPPIRTGRPQRAITINMGGDTNAVLGSFATDALAPFQVKAKVQDAKTNAVAPVQALVPLSPPLAAVPTWKTAFRNARTTDLPFPGLDLALAMAQAMGAAVKSTTATVTVEGELDPGRYGTILNPRALVGVRGAGWRNDGIWYVSRVSHDLRPGSYKQWFWLARDGYGSTVKRVRV